jgi:hypothetical protein
MKRILPVLMLLLPLGASHFACKAKSSGDEETTDPNANGGGNPGGGNNATPEELKKNPIEGIAPAKPVLEAGAFTDGPVWHKELGVLFFTTPLGDGAVYRMLADGRVMRRAPVTPS